MRKIKKSPRKNILAISIFVGSILLSSCNTTIKTESNPIKNTSKKNEIKFMPATREEMKLTWFAKLVRPVPLSLILVAVVAVAIVASIGIGNNDDSNRSVPVVRPTGQPIDCMNLGTGARGERVKCVSGEYDAIIYRIVPAGEECPKDLEEVYKGNGEMFCVFYENKSS